MKVEEKAGNAQTLYHQGVILRQKFNFGLFLRKTFAAEWSSTHGHPPKPETVKFRVKSHPSAKDFAGKGAQLGAFN